MGTAQCYPDACGQAYVTVRRCKTQPEDPGFAGPLSGAYLRFDEDDQSVSQRSGHVKDVLARLLKTKTGLLTRHVSGS